MVQDMKNNYKNEFIAIWEIVLSVYEYLELYVK